MENIKTAILTHLSATNRRRPGLKMAPMIDVIFLLLIFFLVAGRWRPDENLLPIKAATAGPMLPSIPKPEPLVIQISPVQNGCCIQIAHQATIRINDDTLQQNLATFADQLQKHLDTQKRFTTDSVEIICAEDLKWDHLAKIYNILYGLELTDITFQMTK